MLTVAFNPDPFFMWINKQSAAQGREILIASEMGKADFTDPSSPHPVIKQTVPTFDD